MDAKMHDKKSKEYLKAKQEYRAELTARDQRMYGENTKIKYNPSKGTIGEEK
jgi:hypothetical protein